MKVLCLGFPRTGTSTLYKALQSAGYEARHVRDGRTPIGARMLNAWSRRRPVFGAFPDVEAISHPSYVQYWPQLVYPLLEHLRKSHTGLRFVLHTRDIEATIASMTRSGAREKFIRYDIPGLRRGVGGRDAEMAAWIGNFYETVTRLFEGSDRFLSFDIASRHARSRLGAFLGRDVPWWGRAHAFPQEGGGLGYRT